MVELEVHKNQEVVDRGPEFAVRDSGQAGFTAGTRGCHDEVAYAPRGRHVGAGVVVLLPDGGIGTCRQSTRHCESNRCVGDEVHNGQQHAWRPAFSGRTRQACGPSVGLLTAWVTAACARGGGPSALARRVCAGGRLGVRSGHRERSDLERHARQCRADDRGGWPGDRPACRADRAVSDRLASCVDQPRVEHATFRRGAGILRTAFLSPTSAVRRTGGTAERRIPLCSLRTLCAERPDTPAAGTYALDATRAAVSARHSLVLASPSSMRVGLTRSSSVAFSQDMPTAGMPFRSGAPL